MATSSPDDLHKLTQQELRALLAGKMTSRPTCDCGRAKAYVETPHPCDLDTYPRQCEACDPDTAAVVAALLARRAHDERERNEKWALARMLDEIGPHHAKCTFENFIATTDSQRRAVELVSGRWWESHVFVLLMGRPGVGKTHAAIASMREVLRNGGTWDGRALFTTETEFLHEWRLAAANRTHFDGVERLTSAPILILDDLGSGKYTDGSLELLFQVLDYRSRHRKPTLITSNHGPDTLESKLGEKLVSRILENGIARALLIEGDNYRLRAA